MCDMAKAYCAERRVARKRHVCCECRSYIRPGDSYESKSVLFDTWSRYSMCIKCVDAWRALGGAAGQCTFLGELWDTLVESGAFSSLSEPSTVADAAALGVVIGHLYGSAHDQYDSQHEAVVRWSVEWASKSPGRSAVNLRIAHYDIRREQPNNGART